MFIYAAVLFVEYISSELLICTVSLVAVQMNIQFEFISIFNLNYINTKVEHQTSDVRIQDLKPNEITLSFSNFIFKMKMTIY